MRNFFSTLNTNTILSCVFSFLLICASMGAGTNAWAAADPIRVNVLVNGCNNNSICEPITGEDELTCPNDCTYVPPDPEPNPSGGGSGIKGLSINVTSTESSENSIVVNWVSSLPANASISWGSSSDFGMGQLQEIGYTVNHSFTLNNLKPNTTYTVTITAKDLNGRTVTETLLITTAGTTTVSPTIRDFVVTQKGDGAQLTWKNPSEPFDYVRIVKSENFFPSNPNDGIVIYEGSAQSFFDPNVDPNKRYYYSLFVKNSEGFSSGLSQSFLFKEEKGTGPFDDIGEPVDIFGPIYDSAIVTDLHTSPLKSLVELYQSGLELTETNGLYYVRNGEDVLIVIERTDLIPIGSQLFISYFASGDKENPSNYVFEYDPKTRKYVVSFKVSNQFEDAPFIIYIRNNQEIKGISGYFHVDKPEDAETPGLWQKCISNDALMSFVMLGFFALLFTIFIFFIIFSRKKKTVSE